MRILLYAKLGVFLTLGWTIIFCRGEGVYLFCKKNCSQAVVIAEKDCLLQGYEGKKLSAKQRRIFEIH